VTASESVKFVGSLIYAALAVLACAVVGVVACTIQAPAEYLIACAQVLVIHPQGLPARRQVFTAPAGGDPARTGYFYGPARSDLRYIRQVAWGRWRNAADGWADAVGEMTDPAGGSRAATGPPGAGLAIGLIVALPLAAVLTATIWLAHQVLVGVATISVWCTAAILRAVDSGWLRARHIRVRCVACFERIPYPAYLCANPECREIHWNIRPGRYGVVRRVCQCGRRMPTLLLFGAARKMDAICPYRACRHPLEYRPGEAKEIVLPLFGSKGAGKTLLLYGIVKTLDQSSRPGIRLDYADSGTATRMRELDSALAEGFPVPITPAAELPKAYVLRLRIGRYHRIVKLLDAAGELFYDSQRSADLIYLGAATTFVLVIDPLSVNDFWDRLPSAERDRLAAHRSIAPHPQPVYQQTVDRIREMGRQRARRRLAVVFSRADLIGKQSGPGASEGDEVRKWAEDALGLAGLVREAESDFRDVALFHTAAFGSEENTLTALVHWLMRAEGITPPGPGGPSPDSVLIQS
jgi:Double-GTPase 2